MWENSCYLLLCVRKHIEYVGGCKDGQRHWMNLSDLPERGEGGEYRYSGLAHSIGTGPLSGPYADPTSSTALWVPDA